MRMQQACMKTTRVIAPAHPRHTILLEHRRSFHEHKKTGPKPRFSQLKILQAELEAVFDTQRETTCIRLW